MITKLNVIKEIKTSKRDQEIGKVLQTFECPTGERWRLVKTSIPGKKFEGFQVWQKNAGSNRFNKCICSGSLEFCEKMIRGVDEIMGKQRVTEVIQEKKPGRPAMDPSLVKKSRSIRISDADRSFLEEIFKGTIQEFIDFHISKLRSRK